MTAEFNFQLMMQIFFVFQRNQKRITHMLILMRRLNESIMIGDDIILEFSKIGRVSITDIETL